MLRDDEVSQRRKRSNVASLSPPHHDQQPPPRVVRHRGMTLLELTVVIIVLLALISVMFVGARAWKRGSDRAGCVLTLRNVQVAARSYQNLYGYNYGGRPYAEARHPGHRRASAQQGLHRGSNSTINPAAMRPCAAGGDLHLPAAGHFPARRRALHELLAFRDPTTTCRRIPRRLVIACLAAAPIPGDG